jgi:hypothetical protein
MQLPWNKGQSRRFMRGASRFLASKGQATNVLGDSLAIGSNPAENRKTEKSL